MTTWNEVENMTDEEVVELNNKMKRQLVKKLAINAAVTVVVAAAFHFVNKKLENKSEED